MRYSLTTTGFILFLGLLALITGLEWALRRRAADAGAARSTVWETRPLPSPDQDAFRIVALGDSITFGSELAEEESWPSQLGERIRQAYPDRRWQIINAGVSGHTVADAYVRFDEHVRRYQPHLVLIAFGLNDLRQVNRSNDARRQAIFARNEQTWRGKSYLGRAIANRLQPLPAPDLDIESQPASGPRVQRDRYQSILTWLILESKRSGAQPVLLTLTPLSPELDDARRHEFARWTDYNAAIRQVSRSLNIPMIEVSHKLPGAQPWLDDGVHLSAEGEAAVAERVWHALLRPPSTSSGRNLIPALHLDAHASNAEMAPSLD